MPVVTEQCVMEEAVVGPAAQRGEGGGMEKVKCNIRFGLPLCSLQLQDVERAMFTYCRLECTQQFGYIPYMPWYCCTLP